MIWITLGHNGFYLWIYDVLICFRVCDVRFEPQAQTKNTMFKTSMEILCGHFGGDTIDNILKSNLDKSDISSDSLPLVMASKLDFDECSSAGVCPAYDLVEK